MALLGSVDIPFTKSTKIAVDATDTADQAATVAHQASDTAGQAQVTAHTASQTATQAEAIAKEAAQAAQTAIMTANGKNKAYFGATTPINPQSGDIWFVEDDSGNVIAIKHYDGTQWITDVDNDELIQQINDARAAADNAVKVGQAAQQTAADAEAKGDAATKAAAEAKDAATKAQADAAGAVTSANNAVSTANQATQKAQNAIDKAQDGFDTAQDALSKAGTAVDTANTAKQVASDAATQASTAKQVASDAATQASEAKTNAQTAMSNAQDAINKANAANDNANTREKAIIKSNAAPSNPATDQLWIDTSKTPQIMRRWNGNTWADLSPTEASQIGAVSTTTYTTDITNINNTLSQKASVETVNTLSGRLDKAETAITQNANNIALKADKSVVDTLKNTVDNHSTLIRQNADAIQLKADKSTVDTLTGRVSTAETTLTAQADQIAARITKTEADAKYATQTALTATADSLTSQISSAVLNGEIYARGTGMNRHASRILKINGNDYYNDVNARGLRLTVLSRNDLSVTFNNDYDVFGDGAARDNLADKLNSLDDSVIVVLTSCDTIVTNTTLQDAMARCGGSGTGFSWRNPYALIGIPGIGKGNGLEAFHSDDPSAPYAEISTKVINGIPQGINTLSNYINSQFNTLSQTLDSTVSRIGNAEGSISALQQTSDSFATRISNAEGNITTLTQTVNGLQTTVSEKVDKTTYNSFVTQTSQALQSKLSIQDAVSTYATQSQLTQTASSLQSSITQIQSSGNNLVIDPSWEINGNTSEKYHSGNKSLKVVANGYIQDIPLMTVTTSGGRMFYAEVWVLAGQSSWDGVVGLQVSEYNSRTDSWNWLTIQDLPANSGQTWTKLSGYVTVPDGYDKLTIRLSVRESVTKGAVFYFDDAFVTEVSGVQSQISQLANDINLRVQKGDVINQINVSTEGILIDGKKVHITGQTTIDNAVIKDAMIDSMTANKLTAGTIDANVINITNINASNIVTGTLDASKATVENIDASKITTGTLNADRIAAGSIDASKLATGTITAASGVIGSLDASKITTGTLDAAKVNVVNLTADSFSSRTLTSVNINGGNINIGGGNFTVDSSGKVVAKGVELSGVFKNQVTTNTKTDTVDINNGRISIVSYYGNKTLGAASLNAYEVDVVGDGDREFWARIYGDENDGVYVINTKLHVGAGVGYSPFTLLGWKDHGRIEGSTGMSMYGTDGSKYGHMYMGVWGELRVTRAENSSVYRPIRVLSTTNVSLAEMKQDIKPWKESALEQINESVIYEYRMKDEVANGTARRRQGLVIGDGYKTPDAVVDNGGVDQYQMVSWSWKAIQELSAEDTSNKERLSIVEEQNQQMILKIADLESRLAKLEA